MSPPPARSTASDEGVLDDWTYETDHCLAHVSGLAENDVLAFMT